MDKLKFYKILVIILVILNIGTLVTIWLGRMKEPRFPGRKMEGEPLLREMQLTPHQSKEFREQRRYHVSQLREMQSRERNQHERFFDLVFSDQQDSVQALLMIDSLLQIRKKMEMMTYRHFKDIQQMLDPKQKEIFRKNFNRHFNQVLPPPEPPKDIPAPPPPPPGIKR